MDFMLLKCCETKIRLFIIMPKYLESIQGMKDSFQRPVVTEVLRDVMHWTGIPAETRILFPGETEQAYQPGSTIDSQAAFNQFESQRLVSIKVNENILEDHVISISALNKDHAEIFYDSETKVYCRPIYSPCEYVIEITFRAHDLDSANKWRDEIVARVATYRDLQIHQPKYYYVFPDMFMRVIEHVHLLRETGAVPYNETLAEYIRKCMTSRASVLTMGDGEEGRWGIRESQSRVLGWFDFSGVPEKPDRQSDISSHAITISYKFMMERPTACVIEYPIVINNEVIDEHFRQKPKTYTIPEVVSFASRSNTAMGIFESGESTRYRNGRDVGIKIPDFIEFNPCQIHPSTKNIITMLTTIDLNNPKQLFSLADLGDEWVIDPVLIEFMRDEAPWLTVRDGSILNLSVYRNENIINASRVVVDSSLTIFLLDEPDPRDTFHVRLSYSFDWSMLSKAALDRLRYNAQIVSLFIDLMYPHIWEHFATFGTFNTPTGKSKYLPKPAGVKRQYNYPFHGWKASNNGPQDTSNYDTTNGKDIYKMMVKKVISKKPERVLPWDGGATPPNSSSSGIISKVDFDELLKYISDQANRSVTLFSLKNNISHKRILGLFLKSESRNQLEE